MNAVPSISAAPLLEVAGVCKSFPKPDGGELLVLEGVNLRLVQGQIVGLLGRSGSGKSTLLRLIAGLSQPSAGALSYMGKPIDGPADGISMVFQSFALYPWLTVFENVALGLEAQHMEKVEIRKRMRGLRKTLPSSAAEWRRLKPWSSVRRGSAPCWRRRFTT